MYKKSTVYSVNSVRNDGVSCMCYTNIVLYMHPILLMLVFLPLRLKYFSENIYVAHGKHTCEYIHNCDKMCAYFILNILFMFKNVSLVYPVFKPYSRWMHLFPIFTCFLFFYYIFKCFTRRHHDIEAVNHFTEM